MKGKKEEGNKKGPREMARSFSSAVHSRRCARLYLLEENLGIGKGTDWRTGLHRNPQSKTQTGQKEIEATASTTNGCGITTWAGDHQVVSTQGFAGDSKSDG
jgi:hypothetical protein